MKASILPLLLSPLLTSCATKDLSESWLVDRLRVLAVRPEPAEANPGDLLTFESLIVPPSIPVQAVLYFACLAEEASDFGCEIDMEALMSSGLEDPSDMDPEDIAALLETLRASGLIGVEPFMPPSFEVPETALDGLDEWERAQGLNVFVQIVAIPEGAGGIEGDIEIAYKRVPVSDAATPNANPDVIGLRVDGIDVPVGVILELDAGQTYRIEAVIPDTSIESYVYLDSSGTWEDRVEEPYFTFYVEEGELDQEIALHPKTWVEWTTPARPANEVQHLWIVARDRRGGMGWWTQELTIRQD